MDPSIEVRLVTMTTAEEVKHFASELYVNGVLIHVSDWTRHPLTAIRDGDNLRASALSDLAYSEARVEAHALFA